MIKLMPLVEQIHQEQIDEAGVKDIALGAAMAASSIFGGAQAQSKIPMDKPAITVSDTRTGTQVDGKNGKFTSQFSFPSAFLKNLNTGKVKNLGIGGNEVLQQINQSKVSVQQMAEWNNYVKWMDEKGYSGSSKMDQTKFSENVLEQYKKENPNFWIKDSNDIKKIQDVIKAYRKYTIAVWKLGENEAIKKGFTPVSIEFSGKQVDSSNSNDIKRVESNYMPWAK